MVRVGTNPALQALRVIGVAKDAVVSSPQHRNMVVLYENFWQFGPQIQEYPTLIVRSRFGGEVSAAVLEQPVAEGGREYASQSRTVHQQTEASLIQKRLLATVSSLFGGLGLLLAAVGLYGVVSVSVAQRTYELGIRLAIGALPSQIVSSVIGDSVRLVSVGIGIGTPLAWVATRLANAAISIGEPMTVPAIATAVTMLLLIGVAAAGVPALRAARVNPIVAL